MEKDKILRRGVGHSPLPPEKTSGEEHERLFLTPVCTKEREERQQRRLEEDLIRLLLADLFSRAAQLAFDRARQDGHSGTSSPRAVELRQREKIDVPVWNDDFLKGKSVEVAFRVFTSAMQGWMDAEGLVETMRGVEMPVGAIHVDRGWLSQTYGEENVRKAMRIWTCLITKITTQPVQEQILAAESPQAGWRVFQACYTQSKTQEREILDNTWNCLRQKEGESLLQYWGRASAVWMKLRSYGDNREDSSMCKHVARGLLPANADVKDRILFPEVKWKRR